MTYTELLVAARVYGDTAQTALKGGDTNNHAIENARAWYANIREMVATYDRATAACRDNAEQAILKSPLSVRVRSGWYTTGERIDSDTSPYDRSPAEYEILLTTSGPSLRIRGELDEHCEPSSATLQWQDCGTPQHVSELGDDVDATLLRYASHFYFGE